MEDTKSIQERTKTVTYKRNETRKASEFPTATLEARRHQTRTNFKILRRIVLNLEFHYQMIEQV